VYLNGQTPVSAVTFESTPAKPLHSWAVHMKNRPLVLNWWPLFFFLIDFRVWPSKFSNQPFNLFFFLDLVPVFLLLFVLFGIIYKIDFFSILFLFDFFHLLDLVIILFIVVAPDITVVLKNQWKRNIIDFWCLVLW
jgi:hypothetical protein